MHLLRVVLFQALLERDVLSKFFRCQRGQRIDLGLHRLGRQRCDHLADERVALQRRECRKVGSGLCVLGVDRSLQLLADFGQSFEHVQPIGHIRKIVLAVKIGTSAARIEDAE